MTHVTTPSPHPATLWLLKTLLFLLAIFALIPGLLLMIDPSGSYIQFPENALQGSPFSNFFIPGFLLTVFVGLLSLFAWYALWKRPHSRLLARLNPFPGLHWAWTLALLSGCSLTIWILVQMTMVPYFFLQPTLLAWGVLIIILCLTPKIRAFYAQ